MFYVTILDIYVTYIMYKYKYVNVFYAEREKVYQSI